MAVASKIDKVREALTIPIRNPITGQVVGEVPRCTPDDVIAAVARGREAQPGWAVLPFRKRARVIKRFHDMILDRREELFDVIQSESGKSRRDAFVELFAIASEARYYAYHGGQALRPRRGGPGIPLRERTKVIYRPVGVVGIISPWNFPFILAAADAIPALLAGNSVVLKPASNTPLSAIWLRDRLADSGLPYGVFEVVTGPGSALGNALIDHVDFVMFTGSTETGRKVAERAARRLIPYNMELGSKNAVVVLPDANVKHTAHFIAEGTYNNSGQVCINFERVYVDARVYDTFVDELIRQTEALRLGADTSYNTDIGSLISAEQFEKVRQHVDEAVAGGARVLTGGRPRPDLGPYFYEPTILADVTPGMAVYGEETFGPVLCVYKVDNLDEAVRRANDTRYGLHFAVATRDRHKGEQVAARLDAGTVAVNDSYVVWAAMGAPMGGFKESGVGRRHGPDGIRRFTEPQTILTNQTYWQVGSGKTALSFSNGFASLLAFGLRVWRHIPFVR